MEKSLAMSVNSRSAMASINLHGDAVDGFAIGVLVTLVVIFLIFKMR